VTKPQPFRAELLGPMRQRFEEALQGDYLVGKKATSPRAPESLRRHVFDFTNGLRLTICFARGKPKSTPALYMVASFSSTDAYVAAIEELGRGGRMPVTQSAEVTTSSLPGKGLYLELDATELVDWIEGHFRAICGWPCPVEFGFVGENNTFHFAGPSREEYHTMKMEAGCPEVDRA